MTAEYIYKRMGETMTSDPNRRVFAKALENGFTLYDLMQITAELKSKGEDPSIIKSFLETLKIEELIRNTINEPFIRDNGYDIFGPSLPK